MALIAVLWIVGLLALLATGIGSNGRVSSQLAFNALENTKAKYLAEAGINEAIYRLLNGDIFQSPLVDGSAQLSSGTDNGLVTVQIRDEDGKIDLNFATVELLAGLIGQVGSGGEDDARVMAERIIDYRDEDSSPLTAGAEDPAYVAAGNARGAADRPFRQVEELTSVLGITDALYQQIKRHVTVFAGAEGVDPLRASDVVLRALPAIDANTISLIKSSDMEGDVISILPEAMGEALEDYFLTSRNLVFELRALGETDGGGRFLREAMVTLEGGQTRLPFTTLRWRQGTIAQSDPLLDMMESLSHSP